MAPAHLARQRALMEAQGFACEEVGVEPRDARDEHQDEKDADEDDHRGGPFFLDEEQDLQHEVCIHQEQVEEPHARACEEVPAERQQLNELLHVDDGECDEGERAR